MVISALVSPFRLFPVFVIGSFLIVLSDRIVTFSQANEVADDYESILERQQTVEGDSFFSAGISLREFQNLLFSHVDNEFEHFRDDGISNRIDDIDNDNVDESEGYWDFLLKHGWNMAEEKDDMISFDSEGREADARSTFLVCTQGGNDSGFQRLQSLMDNYNLVPNNGSGNVGRFVVVNTMEKTCRFLPITLSDARSIAAENDYEDVHYSIIPVVDIMKISLLTVEEVASESWAIPSPEQNEFLSRLNETVGIHDSQWDRSIIVGLAPGQEGESEENLLKTAANIIADIRMNANESRRRKLLAKRLVRKSNRGVSRRSMTVSDSFSITSRTLLESHLRDNSDRDSRFLRASSREFWSRSLAEGLESYHMCSQMFDDMVVRPRFGNKGFEILLNPDGEISGGWASATNTNCVVSLVAALASRSSVITVESNSEVTSDSNSNAQWISQSNQEQHRPFFDAGITGLGEVVSVSDSGVDTNHCYFKDDRGDGDIFDGVRTRFFNALFFSNALFWCFYLH